VERPGGPDAPLVLCDTAAARRAIERAARLGRPFQVALPTYGYLVAFDGRGRLLGLSAEGPAPAWPEDVRVREMCADPAAMAELVASLVADRPACLEGIIWYRLPVAGDTLNWSWPTLAAVMAGRAPRGVLRAVARGEEPGLAEIALHNDGEADASTQVDISVRWRDARCVAGDAMHGFEWIDVCPTEVQLRGAREQALERLGPGQQRVIGWIRLSENRGVEVHVQNTIR
jgi:hypothetical protein